MFTTAQKKRGGPGVVRGLTVAPVTDASGVLGVVVVLCAVGGLAGCDDLRRFQGSWTGTVSADPNQQKGFAPAATLHAHIGAVTRSEVEASFDLPDAAAPARFEPIRRAAGDVLAEMRLPSEPLRTYLGFVGAADAAAPLLAVVSLFAEERIEVRLIRGADEIYGVFSLRRQPPGAGADAR